MSIKNNWIQTSNQALLKESKDSPRVIVEMYKSPANETPILRGTTQMNASIGHVAFATIDIESKKQWGNRLNNQQLIDGDVYGIEFKSYEYYKLDWPISDREYVLQSNWTIDTDSEISSAQLSISSILHQTYPLRKDRVRGDLQQLIFSLKEVKPNVTEVKVEIQVDPKGELPRFLANMIQKNWPLTILRSLNKELNQGEEKHKLFLI